MSFIAERMQKIKISPTIAVSQAAAALRASGEDVIDLGLGEPDFETPAHIIEAAHQAALAGKTRYTAPGGTAELKAAISLKFKRENNLNYDANEICVGNGAKQVIFNALMATVEQGDEVIIIAPYFVSYPDMVLMMGGRPKVITTETDNKFKLTPAMLEAEITSQTRWLFLNIPSNPAGTIYNREELAALGAVLEKHPHVLILSDEIYEHIIFDNIAFVSFVEACPSLRDHTLVINGVSKAYAMTGWRIGYAAGPAWLIKTMSTVQSQSTSNASSISQAAAVSALTGPQALVKIFSEAFEQRRNLVVDGIASIEQLTMVKPEGAFYAFINCEALMGGHLPDGSLITNDAQISTYLLKQAKVATVPGVAYGKSPFFRISTATSESILSEAITRIDTEVQQITLAKR